jgi:hypothetical protein
MRGLKSYVSLRGEVIKESHGLVNFATERRDVSSFAWSPVTRIPAFFSVRFSHSSTKFRQRPVQLKVADSVVHFTSHSVLFV